MNRTPSYHTPGVTWRYKDGTHLEVQADGSVRRKEPKPPSKKARRRAKKGNTCRSKG